MSLSSLFGFATVPASTPELPNIFPLEMKFADFIESDILNIYTKILTDCIERTQGISDDVFPLLWDNCLQSESNQGLITLLAWAMTDQSDLFLIYNPSLNLLREAETTEATQIRLDYETKGYSDLGVFVSFKNYIRTDMVKLYSSMEYWVIASLNKNMNLSKAIQFKMNDLRGSVSLNDSTVITAQAKTIATALANGRDVLMDAKDEIVTSTPDITSIKESIAFLDAKRSFYLGLPLAYINGEQTGGIGATGEADTRAIERGLKQYFISVLKPVLESVFDLTITFKSNDFRQITSALEAMKTFELVGDELLSQENKRLIISKLFDVEPVSNARVTKPKAIENDQVLAE